MGHVMCTCTLQHFVTFNLKPVATQIRYFPMEKHQIPMEYLTVGFIGAGKMAESIARGIVASGVLPPHHISTAVHSNPDRHEVFQSFGVNVFSSNEEVSRSLSLTLSIQLSWTLVVRCRRVKLTIFNNGQVVEESDVVIFSVKPQVGMFVYLSVESRPN